MSNVNYDLFEIKKGHFIKVLKCLPKTSENIKNKKTLIVIIPGNPGVIEFYEHLADELHNLTNLPIIGISHTVIQFLTYYFDFCLIFHYISRAIYTMII
jgi:hypothetical protein